MSQWADEPMVGARELQSLIFDLHYQNLYTKVEMWVALANIPNQYIFFSAISATAADDRNHFFFFALEMLYKMQVDRSNGD